MTYNRKQKHISAFTLVELSIAIIIIGLIVGGVLGGQSLISSAKRQSIIKEYNSIATAIKAFKLEYDAIPGDMRDATEYWGEISSTPATCRTTVSAGTQTCDGNGDNYIYNAEIFRAWQHLSNAGVINGGFSGVAGPDNASWDHVSGVNCPTSEYAQNVCWTIMGDYTMTGHPWAFDFPNRNNRLWLGNVTTASQWSYGHFISPKHLFQIDKKIDDGKPARGIVKVIHSTTSGRTRCTDAANSTDFSADYNKGNQNGDCSILFDL